MHRIRGDVIDPFFNGAVPNAAAFKAKAATHGHAQGITISGAREKDLAGTRRQRPPCRHIQCLKSLGTSRKYRRSPPDGIRRLKTLRKRHGGRRWRKLRGDAKSRFELENRRQWVSSPGASRHATADTLRRLHSLAVLAAIAPLTRPAHSRVVSNYRNDAVRRRLDGWTIRSGV